jgi:sec-independent protein translocase protein TatA
MPLGLTPAHLVIILVIVLIVVGPGKLPETGAAIGKALRGFKEAVDTGEAGGAGASPATAVVQPVAFVQVPAQGQYAPAQQPYAAQSGDQAQAQAVSNAVVPQALTAPIEAPRS